MLPIGLHIYKQTLDACQACRAPALLLAHFLSFLFYSSLQYLRVGSLCGLVEAIMYYPRELIFGLVISGTENI